MKIKCPHCGAETSEMICEYCGSTIHSEDIGEIEPKSNSIPFKISKEEAISFLYKRLVEEGDVPLDVFNHIKIKKVEKLIIPMFLFNGAIEGSWSATILNEKSRQVTRNGQQRTEYYTEYVPVTGNLNTAFWLMTSSNQKAELPTPFRDYINAVDFTEAHASSVISLEGGNDDSYNDDCKILGSDSEPMTVFRSSCVSSHLNSVATQVAMSQIPGKYQDLKFTWNATGDLKDLLLLSVYYIAFSYKGDEYSYCIDGVGASEYIKAPKDINPAKKLKRHCIYKLVISVILGIVAVCQSFGSSSLLTFGIFFPLLMLFVTNQEWKKGLANIRDLRECERRKFCNESTQKLQGVNLMKWVSNTLIVVFALILVITYISHRTSTTYTKDFKEDTVPYSEQLLKDAERGDANAQLNMGRCYYLGNGVVHDYEKSFYWMKKAAEQGHYVAQHNLSMMYYNGWGCTRNISLAKDWLIKASDAGYAPSQYSYGIALAKGEGFVQDKETGAELIYEAAEKGFIPAKATLGHLYISSGNTEEGLHYTKSAAEDNEPLALYDLGICYIHGTGVPINRDKGLEYLQKSADLKYQPAIVKIKEIHFSESNDTLQMSDSNI